MRFAVFVLLYCISVCAVFSMVPLGTKIYSVYLTTECELDSLPVGSFAPGDGSIQGVFIDSIATNTVLGSGLATIFGPRLGWTQYREYLNYPSGVSQVANFSLVFYLTGRNSLLQLSSQVIVISDLYTHRANNTFLMSRLPSGTYSLNITIFVQGHANRLDSYTQEIELP